jgi:hypothetical protein
VLDEQSVHRVDVLAGGLEAGEDVGFFEAFMEA